MTSATSPATDALQDRRRRTMGASYRLFYRDPVHLVRADGVWLHDAAGRRYLDAYNNVASVGHSNPVVAAAVAAQARVLNTNTRYLTDEVVDYLERLLGYFDEPLSQALLTCSGSEANDLAYRMACAATGGTGVIVTAHAYHGVTAATAQLSPSLGLQLPEHVRTITLPDLGEAAVAVDGAAAAAGQLAEQVLAAAADLRRHGVQPAMLILDTVLASDGIHPDPVGFLRAAVDAARQQGALFVADEVQAGFGRLGAGMWGFSRHGLSPDIVTLGKPMGNGYPLAGAVFSPELGDRFSQTSRYFNTFGGSSMACVAGAAVLDVIEQQQLVANARTTGARLRDGLVELQGRHRSVAQVRGAGLYFGVELAQPDVHPAADLAGRVVNDLRDRGVLVGASGPGGSVVKIRPPLVFGTDHVDQLLTVLDEVLGGWR